MGSVSSGFVGVTQSVRVTAKVIHSPSPPTVLPTMPDDILTLILGMLESTSDPGLLPELVKASHISMQWRQVAVQTGSLWSCIYASPHHSLAMTSAYLSRSQQSLLRITYRCPYGMFESENNKDEIMPSWGLFLPQCHRWQTLTVLSRSNSSHTDELVKSLVPLSVPHLKLICIHTDNKERRDNRYDWTVRVPTVHVSSAPNVFIFSGGTRALTSWKVRGMTPTLCYPPASRLKELDMHVKTWQNPISYGDFCLILSTASDLVRLKLRGRLVDMATVTHLSSPIQLSSLLHLSVEAYFDNAAHTAHYIHSIFSTISAPHLESLVFSSDREIPPTHAFLDAIHNGAAFPELHTLSLENIHSTSITPNFLRSTPKIHTFSLFTPSNYDKSTFLPLLEGSECLWPCLTDLSIDASNSGCIRELVAARINLGHPIRSLHGSKGLVRALSGEDLQWLRGNIELDINFEYVNDL